MRQSVLLLAIGGRFAETIWECVRRWRMARIVEVTDEWSSEQWPLEIRDEIDLFVANLSAQGLAPPILYRSEHLDYWSMGDVYHRAIVKPNPEICCQLFSNRNELIVAWVHCKERIVVQKRAPEETLWLYNRINEATAAWSEYAENRLIILVRRVLGGLCEDHEVAHSLTTIPGWWTTETERVVQPVAHISFGSKVVKCDT